MTGTDHNLLVLLHRLLPWVTGVFFALLIIGRVLGALARTPVGMVNPDVVEQMMKSNPDAQRYLRWSRRLFAVGLAGSLLGIGANMALDLTLK